MPESPRQIFDEYRDMSDGDCEQALWLAAHEIAALGRQVSAGHVRAKPERKPVLIKPQSRAVDDGEAWIQTGRKPL